MVRIRVKNFDVPFAESRQNLLSKCFRLELLKFAMVASWISIGHWKKAIDYKAVLYQDDANFGLLHKYER